MADTIISVYDGKQHKDISCNKILQDGKPTGFYQYEKSEITSNLGTFLDNLENYNQFIKDVRQVARVTSTSSLTHHSYLLTDYGERFFLFTNSASTIAKPHIISSVEEGLCNIITSLGYVHTDYIIHQNPSSIEFTITPKDGSKNFKLFFIPMDNQCYLIK